MMSLWHKEAYIRFFLCIEATYCSVFIRISALRGEVWDLAVVRRKVESRISAVFMVSLPTLNWPSLAPTRVFILEC